MIDGKKMRWSEYKQMLKQRKHSPFDDGSSPDGNHYSSEIHKLNAEEKNDQPLLCLDPKEDDVDDDLVEEEEEVDDECSSDVSDNSQKGFAYAD